MGDEFLVTFVLFTPKKLRGLSLGQTSTASTICHSRSYEAHLTALNHSHPKATLLRVRDLSLLLGKRL